MMTELMTMTPGVMDQIPVDQLMWTFIAFTIVKLVASACVALGTKLMEASSNIIIKGFGFMIKGVGVAFDQMTANSRAPKAFKK